VPRFSNAGRDADLSGTFWQGTPPVCFSRACEGIRGQYLMAVWIGIVSNHIILQNVPNQLPWCSFRHEKVTKPFLDLIIELCVSRLYEPRPANPLFHRYGLHHYGLYTASQLLCEHNWSCIRYSLGKRKQLDQK
jgi:hypothetical protein